MKTILLGNAGAGKSTMAKRLISSAGDHVARLSLDEIAWNQGLERKPLEESRRQILRFIQSNDSWIIEGCYSDLVAIALPYCTELRFLNPGVEACIRHCHNRPWEPEKYSSPEEQQAMLNQLIQWVSTYESRTDEYSLASHRALYESYPGTKREYTRVSAYDDV